MSKTSSLYELVHSAIRLPLSEPWSLKDRVDSRDDAEQETETLFDHPEYTAVLRCYRSFQDPADTSASITCFRKDRRTPTHEELVTALAPLFTQALRLTRGAMDDQDDWITIEQTPDHPWGFTQWLAREPGDPESLPSTHYALELSIPCPEEEHCEEERVLTLTKIPGLELEDDYAIVKLATERVEELEGWLQVNGYPPLQEIETPDGETCLAHSAEILERFDRSNPHPCTSDDAEDHVSRVIGGYAIRTLLCCFPKGQTRYRTWGDLPIGAILDA